MKPKTKTEKRNPRRVQRGASWLAQLYPDANYVRIFPNRRDDDACWALMDIHLHDKKPLPANADDAIERVGLRRTGNWRKHEGEWWEANIMRKPANAALCEAAGKKTSK